MNKKQQVLDYKTSLIKAQKHCAYQERSQQEIRNKLYEWGLHSRDIEQIIVELINTNFLNEERFAMQITSGKFRIKHWGKIKIIQALKLHKISPYCIKKALQQIPDDDYEKSLRNIIDKKRASIKGKMSALNERKIAHFAQSKGYESELIWKVLKQEIN